MATPDKARKPERVSNAEIEMRWVNAWSDLAEIIGDRWQVSCMLPDGSIVDAEVCRGWLQDSVYDGYLVNIVAGWICGRQGVIVSRTES